MPIQFPQQTGPVRSYVEAQWWARNTKYFAAVPAPKLGSVAPVRAVNLRRFGTMYQSPEQTATVNPAAQITQLYDLTKGFTRVLGTQNERIIGVSRDAGGVALGDCAVKVFRTADDALVGSTTSAGSGDWTVYPNQTGPYYFVEYKAGIPDVFGTSPNTNTSTQFTPGQ